MLSGNFSEWPLCRAYIPCPTVTIVKWCHTVMQNVNSQKVVAGIAHKKIENKKYTNILTSEASLEPSQTSMTDLFCKNSKWLKVVNYFRKEVPSHMFGSALNTLLYLIWKTCISTQKMVAGVAHKNILKSNK